MIRFLMFVSLAAVAAFLMASPTQAQVVLPPLAPELQAIVDCEDPAFPPQSPSGQCATLIEVVGDGAGNDSRWNCTQPLSNYGPLPIIVNHIEPNAGTNPPGAIALGNTPRSYPATGCTVLSQRVDGVLPTCNFDQKADLFLQINGNRTTLGSNNDLVKTFGAHCIEIGDPAHSGGKWTAGQVSDGAHQDGHNCNYCRGLHYYGIEIGDWESQVSGAHGAGGLWYMSSLRDEPQHHHDIVCYGCLMVGSSHPGGGGIGTAFSHYGSDSSGAVDSCFSANHPYVFRADALNPVNERNLFIDRDDSQPDNPQDCPLVDDDPPPPPPLAQCEDGLDNDGDALVDMADPGCASASDNDEFNEPDPPPPPPGSCDQACVDAYEAQIDSLQVQLDACIRKLKAISAFFHVRPKDVMRAYKMHSEVHRPSLCSAAWHG